MIDYRNIALWQKYTPRKTPQIDAPGIYSIWNEENCMYVGMAEKSILCRIQSPTHPWKAAKYYYKNALLRFLLIEGSKRDILIEESLAIGQLRPVWNYGGGIPKIPKESSNPPIGCIRIHRKVKAKANQLIGELFEHGVDLLNGEEDVEIDTDWMLQISSLSKDDLNDALENLVEVGIIENLTI